MPIRFRTVAMAIAGLLAAATVILAPAPAHAATTCTMTLFTPGGAYGSYRIPALVNANGVLVAFAEARATSSDTGKIAIVERRSTDGGCTWSAQTRVAADGGQTIGNPTPMVAADGTLVLVTMWNGGAYTQADLLSGTVPSPWGRRVYVQISTDQGATWSTRREITATTKDPSWMWYATGPGHGLTLTTGAHAGRLVAAADHWGIGDAVHGVNLLISDDGGATWRIGASDDHTDGAIKPDESSAAELPDGRIYISARDQGGSDPTSRDDTYSSDAGETFVGPFAPQPAIVTSEVEGSTLQDPGLPTGVSCHPLLYSGPQDPNVRQHLTVRRSDDGGLTWRTVTTITAASTPAGYSDITKINRTTLGVLYETGSVGYAERIDVARVTVACP